MGRVVDARGDRDQQIAALLHDSLEDGKATAASLLEAGVPPRAVEMVLALTRDVSLSYPASIAQVKQRQDIALIKRADLADNADPERLALLPASEQSRLRDKYAAAVEILEGA